MYCFKFGYDLKWKDITHNSTAYWRGSYQTLTEIIKKEKKLKKFNYSIYVIFTISLLLLTRCATTPTVQIWQPWTRVLKSEVSIPLNSKIKIIVEGDSKPLLGNELLLQNDIKEKLKYLLERRGYKIVTKDFQFLLTLKYKTERHDKTNFSSLMYSSSNNLSTSLATSGSLTSLGLGVSIAQTVSALSNKSSAISQNISETVKSYTHTISIEISNVINELIWQGESAWDSPNINLQTDIKTSIQLIVSNLPKNKEKLPSVSKVKKGKEENYYNLVCKDRWFSCPALPYRIKFEMVSSNNSQISDYSLPSCIKNPYALAAYVDLIQTAEYVLPLGMGNYNNPLKNSLWSEIQLGDIYQLSDNEQIKILIKLKGEKNGYLVNKCWVATDEDFAEFEMNLKKWRDSLIDYYDVFEE